MCLAIPGKIISINDTKPDLKMGRVSFAGVIKEVCLEWIDNPMVGEYVLVHVGFALEKIKHDEAEETIRLINEIEENGSL